MLQNTDNKEEGETPELDGSQPQMSQGEEGQEANSDFMKATVSVIQSRDVRAASLPSFGVTTNQEVGKGGSVSFLKLYLVWFLANLPYIR